MTKEEMYVEIHNVLNSMKRLRSYASNQFSVDAIGNDVIYGFNCGAASAQGLVAYEAFLNFSIHLTNLQTSNIFQDMKMKKKDEVSIIDEGEK